MSRFDELESNAPTKPPIFHMELEMDLDCSVCNEEVEMVKYFPNESMLLWECSHGHKSMLEGFNLDTTIR